MAGKQPPKLRWIKQPSQDRSRQKLERILDAVEALLEKRSFDNITVADIMKRAGASVGVFYTRFADKEALLAALEQRHLEELSVTGERMLDPDAWAGESLESFTRALVSFAVRFHRRRRGLLRALVLRSHAGAGPCYADAESWHNTTLARVAAIVASKRSEVSHRDPRLAGSLAYLMMLGVLREKILFGDGVAGAVRCSDRRLAEELTNALLAYLQRPTGRRTHCPGQAKKARRR